MKTYRAKFNPDAKNVYGVSLVENPAMEGNFIQFSKQEEIKFADVDKSKRRVMGLILEPDKSIPRNSPEGGYNIVFTAQDIEDVAYNFQKQSSQSTSTIEHSNKNIEGVTFVETWIVENPNIDKSTNFGFSYPKGSWMGVMQLDNDEVWTEYVANGKVKGFSIDAFMQLEEINLTLKQVDMSETKEDNLIKKVIDAIALTFNPKKEEVIVEEVVELADMPKEDDEEKKKLAEADLAEDGMDVPPTEAPKEEGKSDAEVLSDLIKMLQDMLAPMKEESVAMSKKLSELEAKFSKQETELVALSKQPATQTVKKAPTQLDFSKMTEKEKFLYHRNND